MWENTDQKKLCIWTHFTQWFLSPLDWMIGLDGDGKLTNYQLKVLAFECMEYKNTIKYGFYFAGERRKSKFAGSHRAVHKFCGCWLW